MQVSAQGLLRSPLRMVAVAVSSDRLETGRHAPAGRRGGAVVLPALLLAALRTLRAVK